MRTFEKALSIVKEAGKMLRTTDFIVKEKGVRDLVTSVDLAVEERIKTKLSEVTPNDFFVGEESGTVQGKNSGWILDPVDGTVNFVRGLGFSAISLARVRNGRVLYGIVYNPFREELFTAIDKEGAFLNGKRIYVDGVSDLSSAVVAAGSGDGAAYEALGERCLGVRRLGAASLELSYVAAGRLSAYIEENLHPWDFAAGVKILEEAGGVATTKSGKALRTDRCQSVVATNGLLHVSLLEMIE